MNLRYRMEVNNRNRSYVVYDTKLFTNDFPEGRHVHSFSGAEPNRFDSLVKSAKQEYDIAPQNILYL